MLNITHTQPFQSLFSSFAWLAGCLLEFEADLYKLHRCYRCTDNVGLHVILIVMYKYFTHCDGTDVRLNNSDLSLDLEVSKLLPGLMLMNSKFLFIVYDI